jgi:hypothetical protein
MHRDLCGPVTPATPGERRYFLLLINDLSRYMWVVVLGSKGEATNDIRHRRPPPPPQLVTPCTLASTATPTPAHVEHNSHDEERIDAYHDGESLRYRTMENLLSD